VAYISHDPDDDKSTPKFFAFRKKFNWPPYQALGFLCAFWINVLKSETYETGEISDWTGEFLADRIGVGNVNPNELWEALVDGYVETKSDGRRLVRDWIKIAGPWLRQKYANREHGKERLRFIWSLHGLPYGREQQDQKSPESRPKEDPEYAESRPTVALQSARSAPPDIIKEPPKDGEEEGEGNASFSPSWETEGKKEAAPLFAPRLSRIPIELEDALQVERRDGKARHPTHELMDRFKTRLGEELGETVPFSFEIWGAKIKALVKDGFTYDEVGRRFEHWLASTDPYIRENLTNPGIFHQKFPYLKAGPISNRGSRNGAGRAPFPDGAATAGRAEEFQT
jgi:hypothetical protein